MKCAHEWRRLPRSGYPDEMPPGYFDPGPCPRCGSLYYEWVDFEDWRARNPIE